MIDPKFIRENSKLVEEGAKNKGIDLDLKKILTLDDKYRALDTEVQALRAKRNEYAKAQNVEEGKNLKNELTRRENDLRAVEEELNQHLHTVPNLPAPDVKVGRNESENEVVKKHGEPKKFDFTPRDHVELGKMLDIIDVEAAAKVSGARFSYLKNEAALLEFALVQYALQTLTKEGFIPVVPPALIKQEHMRALGYTQQGGDDDMFHLEKDNLTLVGTAEHAIVPMHKDEILDKSKLPLRYVGFSPAFRREAGSYGRDTKGIFRVHQFDKIEMVSFVEKGQDEEEQKYLLGLEEKLFQALEIPYQVVKMCTGDLGFPAARKYDIEAWIPSQNKYREVTSVSTVTDFQSRRLNIKYREGDTKEYAHILNGTAYAIGRTLVAILENHQQADGSVVIPSVLRQFVGFEKINIK